MPAEPTRVPELSTAMSDTVLQPDGSYTVTAYTTEVNYEVEPGEWAPIDNELVDAAGAAYAVENAANDYTVQIPQNAATTPVRFAVDDSWVTVKMRGMAAGAPEVDGSTAEFDDVAGAETVALEATDQGLKETIHLGASPSTGEALTYVYDLQTSLNLTPVLTPGGTIEFRTNAGEVPFVVPVGNMLDSATPTPAYTEDVTYDLAPVAGAPDGGWKLTVRPSVEWLLDPARVYPVVIDPSLTDRPFQRDCWIRSGAPTSSHCGHEYIKAGRTGPGDEFRGLLDFDTSGVPTNATVNSASAHIFLNSNEAIGVGENDYALFAAGKVFDGSATWNSSGATGGWDGGSPTGAARGTRSLAGGGDGYRAFGDNLAALVQTWVTTPSANMGVVLKQTNGAADVVIHAHSSDGPATKRPYMNITYTIPAPANRAPLSPAALRATPGDAGYNVTSTTPTLFASATDPDGDAIAMTFRVDVLDGFTGEPQTSWSRTTGLCEQWSDSLRRGPGFGASG